MARMASNPESHADIVKEMREFGDHCAAFGEAYSPERWEKLFNRLEAAHKRELAEQEAEALKCGAFVEAARKPKRNCDRFGSFDEAWNVFSVEHINAPGETNIAYFASWLFAPCEEGGEK